MSGREINAVKHLGEVEMFTMCTIHIIFFQLLLLLLLKSVEFDDDVFCR